MFGDGATSSSESSAPSALGVPECGIPETVPPLRTIRIGDWSSPRCWTGTLRLELAVVRGSRLEAALDGGCRVELSFRPSAGEVGGTRVGVPLGTGAGTGLRIGVYARSGVLQRSEVLRIGDWSRPVRTDPVFFLLTPADRVPQASPSELNGRVPPSCWLAPATVGGFSTRGTSPTSYSVPVGDPGAPW